jgi:outer membrane protein TolC
MGSKLQLAIGLLFSIFLNGCMVGPNYVRPSVVIPEHYKEKSPTGWKVAEPRDASGRGEWWKIFHDHRLNVLENKLTISNQNIAVAIGQYNQARALVDQASANLYPTLVGNLSITRQRQVSSSSSVMSGNNGTSGTGATMIGGSGTTSSSKVFTTHSWSLNALWEPDIWGTVRRAVEASVAGAQASKEQLNAIELSAKATPGSNLFSIAHKRSRSKNF